MYRKVGLTCFLKHPVCVPMVETPDRGEHLLTSIHTICVRFHCFKLFSSLFRVPNIALGLPEVRQPDPVVVLLVARVSEQSERRRPPNL